MHRTLLFLSRYNNHHTARRRRGALYTTSSSDASASASSSYIVVGNGPVGSSIAKHLVQLLASANNNSKVVNTTTPKVTIIDGKGVGIGSSHADRARLIRTFDAEGDDEWTKWNIRSLESFPDIEKMWSSSSLSLSLEEVPVNKNKSFFSKCGALLIGDEEFVKRSKNAADKVMMMSSMSMSSAAGAEAAGKLQQCTVKKTPSSASSSTTTTLKPTPPIMMSSIECQKKWPFLKPKVGCDVALFDSSGGIIDPNAFIEAQNTITAAIAAVSATGAGTGTGTGTGTSRNVTTIDDDDDDDDNDNNDHDHEAIVHNNVDFEIISDEVIKVGCNMVELASSSSRKILYADKVIVCGGAYTKPLLKNSG
jgi:glycine/D-amino acid oxidase-like deaminating enzyme